MSKDENGQSTASPRTEAPVRPPSGNAGLALLDEVHATMQTMAGLLEHEPELGAEAVDAIRTALVEADERLRRHAITVAVIGEEQSGKSTLIDALIGQRLLGCAGTPPDLATSVRNAPVCEYTAAFANGDEEHFSQRVPDPRPRLTVELARAERALAEARSHQTAVRARVAGAEDAIERARGPRAEAFRALESARREAAQATNRQEEAEQQKRTAEGALARAESAVPIVALRKPPWWAFWLWLAHVIVCALARHRIAAYHEAHEQRRVADEQLAHLRTEAALLTERCSAREHDLPAADAPVEAAERALAAATRQREAADAEVVMRERQREERILALEDAPHERTVRFCAELRALLDPQQRLAGLVRLDIEMPTRLLPDDVIIMDVPGVASRVIDDKAHARALQIISREADGFVLVSELERAVSGQTMATLQELREIVPHAILVLTKMDDSLAEANRKAEGDPWKEVEKARRISTRRFAREVGRDPSTVLSVAVAAQSVLDDRDPTRRYRQQFDEDIATLFELVRRERVLILGARCASIVRGGLGRIEQAAQIAERTYHQRLAELLAKRTPNPEGFRTERMAACEASMNDGAARVAEGASLALAAPMQIVDSECTRIIMAARHPRDLRAVGPELERVIADGVVKAAEEVREYVDRETRRTLLAIEEEAFRALRQQYDLLHEIMSENASPVRIETPDFRDQGRPPVPTFEARVRTFEHARMGIGVGGAVAGAAVGTLLLFGAGSGLGALLGSSAVLAWPMDALRRACAGDVKAHLAAVHAAMAERTAAIAPSIATTLRERLEHSIAEALARFQRYIAEPIEAERTAIQKERERLQDLQSLCCRLEQLDRNLAHRMQEAGDESLGLCRDRSTDG